MILQSPFTQIARHNVLQVRLHKGSQGAAVPFVPDLRAKRGDKVSQSSIAGSPEEEIGLTVFPRLFINRAYPTMKKHNPHTPILIREAAGTLPRVYARYGTFKYNTYITSLLEGKSLICGLHFSARKGES